MFWLTVIYYKISWVRAVGHSGILVPHSIYIHINISVWDFIYLLIIAVKFCNIYKVLNKKKQANAPTYGVRPGQNTLSLFYKNALYKDIAFKLKINKDGKASKSKSLRHHNSSIIYIDD